MPDHASKIERRQRKLSPAALRLLRVAALAGEGFSAGLASVVLRANAIDLADAWRELEAARLIDRNGLVDPLVAEIAARSIPVPPPG